MTSVLTYWGVAGALLWAGHSSGSVVWRTCTNPGCTEAASSSAGTALMDSHKGQGCLV